MIKNILAINIYHKKIRDYIALFISLFLIQTIFHIFCFHKFELIGFNLFIYKVHLIQIIISALFSLLILTKKGQILGQLLIIIITTFLYVNLLYYRSFGEFIPLSNYLLLDNLHGFESSLLTLTSYFDFLFCLPLIVYNIGLNINLDPNKYIILKTNRIIFISLIIIISPFILYSKDILVDRYRDFISVYNYGLISKTTINIYKEITKNNVITFEERKIINDYLKEQKKSISQNSNTIKKNIIVLLVESLESWVIQKSINNKEITPYLNNLLTKDSSIVYFPKVITQVNGGRSSDAQLIINTGILPIKNGATCFKYTYNYLPNLGSELKKNNQFKRTITMIGYSSNAWNQREFNNTLGFDTLVHIKNYKNDFMICEGINDNSFLQQSLEKLKGFQQPYYAQIITLSSHSPFIIPESLKIFKSNNYNQTFLDYINSIHYVDNAIGTFIDQLKRENIYNNSIVLITGDHNTGMPTKLPEWQEKYTDLCGVKSYIPFMILNSGKSLHINYEVDQIDLFPSIIEILNINSNWKGLGESVLSESYNLKVQERKDKFNDENSIWNISDIIITKKYFRNTKAE